MKRELKRHRVWQNIRRQRTDCSMRPEGENDMKLYLTRHGQTDWNAEKRIQGCTDIPLNAVGIGQAEALAKRVEEDGTKICRIYTSWMNRAKTTGSIVAEHMGYECLVRDGLEEIRFGDWEGLTWDEVRKQFPEEFDVWFHARRYTRPPKGESYQDVLDRMIPALREIIKREQELSGGETEEETGESSGIMVITHGGVLMDLLSAIHNKPFEDMTENFKIDNTTLVEMDSSVILGL